MKEILVTSEPRMGTRNLVTKYQFDDRRFLPDRRIRKTSLVSILRISGRRRGFRRENETQNQYVDCPSKRTIALTIVIFILSTSDAYLTMFHLERGAWEMNPVMNLVLHLGPTAFFSIKALGVGLGAFFLAVHQNFKLGWMAVNGLMVVYAILLAYDIGLFLKVIWF